MNRNPERIKRQHTKPDHRPMAPEFASPDMPLDVKIREVRRRFAESNPEQIKKWR